MQSQEIEWLLRDKYGGEKSEAFFADCKRLALGEPLGYIIGFVPFLDCRVYLDSKPLIPRPETEFWAREAISTIRNGATLSLGLETKVPHILDLCAGSGCIGVAVLKAIEEARVDFSEIDARHLPTIKKNMVENGLAVDHTKLFHTDLFKGITATYDFILTNPPYIDESLKRVEESVVNHEPYVALFGGKDGMETITEIICSAPQHLVSGGQLWMEHEPEQSAAIAKLASENSFSITTHNDQYDIERYSILVLQ